MFRVKFTNEPQAHWQPEAVCQWIMMLTDNLILSLPVRLQLRVEYSSWALPVPVPVPLALPMPVPVLLPVLLPVAVYKHPGIASAA